MCRWLSGRMSNLRAEMQYIDNVAARGKSLQAANPPDGCVPGMVILGMTVLHIVLPPDDIVRNIQVRVIKGLPHAFIF